MSTRPGPESALPFVDDHRVMVAAPAPAVWRAVGASLPDTTASRVGAFLLGARPRRAHGDPLVGGSAVPAFGVRRAVPGHELVLAGRHHFSDYSLVFTLEDRGEVTELSARTLARFPGPHGRVYRALVIGSGAHRILTRRWLGRIRSIAEAGAQ
jgi:hypothetical protein